MRSNNSKGSRAAWARGFAALWAMLPIGLILAAFPAEAAPFAYVTNSGAGTVSVIDTAMNPPSVVATVTVGSAPLGSPSARTGNMLMSRILTPTMSR